MQNPLDDSDVRRYCMQINARQGVPVPGILLDFSTVIVDGLNLFGQRLAAPRSAQVFLPPKSSRPARQVSPGRNLRV